MAQFNYYSCIKYITSENNIYSSTIFIKNTDVKNILVISIIYPSHITDHYSIMFIDKQINIENNYTNYNYDKPIINVKLLTSLLTE